MVQETAARVWCVCLWALVRSDEATIQFIVHVDAQRNKEIILRQLDRKHLIIQKSQEEYVRQLVLKRARDNAFNPDTD